MGEAIRCAYADPPYLGLASYYNDLHPDALDYDNPETHRLLIQRMNDEFKDGWLLSLHTPSLRTILPMCPEDCRVGSWVKPFASFKPGVNPGYAWEPYIWRGGRKFERTDETVRDWCAVNITLKRGFVGAKPQGFCFHVFRTLNLRPGDDFVDLFSGSGAVSAAWRAYIGQPDQVGMFA